MPYKHYCLLHNLLQNCASHSSHFRNQYKYSLRSFNLAVSLLFLTVRREKISIKSFLLDLTHVSAPARNCGLPIFLMHPSEHKHRAPTSILPTRQKAIQARALSQISQITTSEPASHSLWRSSCAVSFELLEGRTCFYSLTWLRFVFAVAQPSKQKTAPGESAQETHNLWSLGLSTINDGDETAARPLLAPIFDAVPRWSVFFCYCAWHRESIKERAVGFQATNNCAADRRTDWTKESERKTRACLFRGHTPHFLSSDRAAHTPSDAISRWSRFSDVFS